MSSPVRVISAKAQEWARQRQGPDREPLVLLRRRVYILPTRAGLAFSLVLLLMLLGSMNYNNSLGIALTFLLAGLALVAMHHCHRNLLELVVRFGGAEPVFAGQNAAFRILLDANASRPRYGLQLGVEREYTPPVDLEPGQAGVLMLEVPTSRRGTVRLRRFSVSTTHPFGLFRAWAWIHLDLATVVYPTPAASALPPPPQRTDTGAAQDDTRGDADFAGLRNFRPGDSPRHVAWKAFARAQELMVKQYAGTDVATHWFDFESLPQLALEARLSQLCRWIVDAQGKGHAYGLRLPELAIEPNVGRQHRHRCLTALALH